MEIILPIVLAGGSGKRLWPMSTNELPKQFHCLLTRQSLLQSTLRRIHTLPNIAEPLILTQEQHRFVVAEQIHQLDISARILLEKAPHNTAAAITLGVLYALSQSSDPLILVCPSDQSIDNDAQFSACIHTAAQIATQGKLVTFGIVPTEPASQYGYIQKGNAFAQGKAYEVQKFVEKPTEKLAQSFLDSGDYFWNSGIFLFRASVFLEELRQYAPELLEGCQQAMGHIVIERDFVYLDTLLENCPNLPIDTVIFEKTRRAIVVPYLGEWHDLGTWNTMYALSKKDTYGNVTQGDIVSFDTTNSYLYSKQSLLVTSGMRNCCIVVTQDAVLVADLANEALLDSALKEIIQSGR